STPRFLAPFARARPGRRRGRERCGCAARELRERTGALVAQLAARALAAAPDVIVERLDLIEQRRVVGDDADLEVAPAAALRAEPGAGPVRAAEIEQLAV